MSFIFKTCRACLTTLELHHRVLPMWILYIGSFLCLDCFWNASNLSLILFLHADVPDELECISMLHETNLSTLIVRSSYAQNVLSARKLHEVVEWSWWTPTGFHKFFITDVNWMSLSEIKVSVRPKFVNFKHVGGYSLVYLSDEVILAGVILTHLVKSSTHRICKV